MTREKSVSPTSMTRRQAFAAASSLVIGSSLGGFRPALAQAAPLRWGSASLGSTGYVIIEALASTVSRLSDVKGSSVATGGAVENMALIGRKEIDLGQTSSLEWPIAYAGGAPFKQKIEPVQLLCYAIWSLHPIVRADSGIKTINDLVGKRISPGPAGGNTALLWRLIFQKAGLYDKVRWNYASWRETYDGMKAGALDCIGSILVDGRPSSILNELEATVKVRPVVLEPDLIKEVQKDQPGMILHTVTPDRWKSLDGPFVTSLPRRASSARDPRSATTPATPSSRRSMTTPTTSRRFPRISPWCGSTRRRASCCRASRSTGARPSTTRKRACGGTISPSGRSNFIRCSRHSTAATG